MQWFVKADPRSAARAVRWAAVALGAAGLIVLAVTRAWHWLPALLIPLIPWIRQFRALRNLAKGARGPTGGRQSAVETAWFRMQLDHDTGEMDGEVLHGAYEGRSLSSLGLSDLLAILTECRDDEQSAAVLAAYLDRAHPEWRDSADGDTASAGRGPAPSGGTMGIEEAREVLGVGPDATPDEVKAAHRRLMKQVHPDHGGSAYLAAKINQAKDVLLDG